MSNPTYFVQGCPTCGRRLQIRVEYLGKRIMCRHCQGQFVACDPAGVRYESMESDNTLLHRANELLASVDQRWARQRAPHPR